MATNITEFSKRVQPDVIGCPKQVVDNAVIDAIIKFCEDTHVMEKAFEHDVVTADIIAADNDSVNVNMETYLAVAPATMTVRALVVTEFRIDGSLWETSYIDLENAMGDIADISVVGTKFFTYPDMTHIKFYDITAQDQRFYIKQAYAPLPSITTVDDDFYYRWHKGIEAQAKWELMSMPKKDWSNAALAIYNLNQYNGWVASAKIKKDQGYTKGSMRVKSTRWF